MFKGCVVASSRRRKPNFCYKLLITEEVWTMPKKKKEKINLLHFGVFLLLFLIKKREREREREKDRKKERKK